MKNELWSAVKNFEGIYEVSNTGKIRTVEHKTDYERNGKIITRLTKSKELKKSVDKYGFEHVSLCKNGVVYGYAVHRLVAEAFIPNAENLIIEHIDGNRSNNAVENIHCFSVDDIVVEEIKEIEWRPVAGYENAYEVSNDGRVRSKRGILNPGNNGNGYMYVWLCKDGKVEHHYVHRLVAEAFIGKITDGLEIDHYNADRTDNRVTNLRLVTHAENLRNPLALEKARLRGLRMRRAM